MDIDYATAPSTLIIYDDKGAYPVMLGQSFTTHSGDTWQIKGWSGTTYYSPCGSFGTPGVVCVNLKGQMEIFCGDSTVWLLRDRPYERKHYGENNY